MGGVTSLNLRIAGSLSLLAFLFLGCGQDVERPPPIPEGGSGGRAEPGPVVIGTGDTSSGAASAHGGADNDGGRNAAGGSDAIAG
jgi:hypothetical protein